MLRCLSLIFLTAAAALAATPEDQARAVLDQWKAATGAKDIDAASRLLAKDCVVIMTEPSADAKHARFFTRESYLKLLKSDSQQLLRPHRRTLRMQFLRPRPEMSLSQMSLRSERKSASVASCFDIMFTWSCDPSRERCSFSSSFHS